MQRLSVISLISGTLVAGCVSSASYERLKRQQQLAGLELANKEHARGVSEQELAQAKARIAQLEQQVAGLTTSLDERGQSAAALEKQYADERARRIEAESALEKVRGALAAGSLASKEARAQLLNELKAQSGIASLEGPATAAPVKR